MTKLSLFCFYCYLCICWSDAIKDQSAIAQIFDIVLSKAKPKYNLINSINYIEKYTLELYDPCTYKQKDRWQYRKWKQKQFKLFVNVCGLFGSISPSPKREMWTLHPLLRSLGIRITINYLNLPFLGLGCRFANLTFTSQPNNVLCGRNSGMELFSQSILIVTMVQAFRFHEESGFVATFVSSNNFLAERKRFVVQVGNEPRLNEIPFYYKSEVTKNYSWYLISQFYTRMNLTCATFHACRVYDGPWSHSPTLIVNKTKTTSGNLAYIEQWTPSLAIRYNAFIDYLVHNDTEMDITSLSAENKVSMLKLSEHISVMSIHSLHVEYTSVFNELQAKCQYGGLHVYSRDNSHKWNIVMDFCQTTLEKEFTIYLDPKKLEYFLVVSFYTGFSNGHVYASFQSKPCSVLSAIGTINMNERCNQFNELLLPDKSFPFHIRTRHRAGPMKVSVQVRNTIYTQSTNSITISNIDRNTFGKNTKFSTRKFTSDSELELQNPSLTIISHSPTEQSFTSIALMLIIVDMKSFCLVTQNDQDNVRTHRISNAALLVALNACYTSFIGSLVYTMNFIVDKEMHYHAKILYDGACVDVCGRIHINATEYDYRSEQYLTVYFRDATIPFGYENSRTSGSAQLVITQENIECRNCALSVNYIILNMELELRKREEALHGLDINMDNVTSK